MVGQNIGKYRVLDRIGRGGMGTVYRALDETLHREVAIKVLNAELNDPEVARRFRAEAVTVARLNHPGIATIYELFQNDGQWLMVMEYVRGETLERMVDRLGPQSPQRAADLLMQALSALAHAHGQGVVHRDLKPANLMGTEAGAVKIMDFGIARVTGAEHLTSAGFMMGTPAYMAPEQVLGQEIDARTDLYALGVVFYYLLSGKLPFKGETPIAMAQSRINDQPTPLHNVREGLPPWLEPVLDRALAKQPEARFQTADLFREALRRGLAGLPMDASASVPTELIQTPPPNAMPIVGASTSLGTGASTAGASTANATMPLASAAPTVLSPSPTPPTVVPIAPPRTPPAAASPASRADAPPAAPPKPPAPPVSAADRKPSTAPGSAASSSSKATTAPKTNTGMLVGIAVVVAIALGGGFWWTRHRANQAAANQAAVDQSAATSPAAPAPASDPNSAASTTPAQTPPDASGATAASTTSTTPSTTPPANAAATPTATGAGTTPAGAAPNAASAAAARGAAPTSGRGAPATPPAIPGDELIQFQDAKVLLIAGRKADDEDVTVQLGGGEVIVAPRKGGAPIAAEPYARIVRATFVHARDPRWESALPHPADSPLDLPGVFHPARNWLVLQSRTDFVILRLDDSNVTKVLDAIQSRAGMAIARPK